MAHIDLGEDVGFVTLKLGGVEKEVDLFEANGRIAELADRTREQPPAALLAGVVEYLVSLGFPKVSHHAADRFVAGVIGRIRELKNAGAGEPSPDSPASTEPASSP